MGIQGIESLFDLSVPAKELAIFPNGTDIAKDGWIPCRFPERPIDDTAAVSHYRDGYPCKACLIAWEAHNAIKET